jgi:hypothetical protein
MAEMLAGSTLVSEIPGSGSRDLLVRVMELNHRDQLEIGALLAACLLPRP